MVGPYRPWSPIPQTLASLAGLLGGQQGPGVCSRTSRCWLLSDPVDPSFRALSGRLNLTDRRHQFNEDSPLVAGLLAILRERIEGKVGTVPAMWEGEAFSRLVPIHTIREGYHESPRCSRDTYPESNITKCTSIRKLLRSEI